MPARPHAVARALRGAILALALLAFVIPLGAAAPAAALPGDADRWLRVETAHFTLFSDARASAAEELALELERLRAALERLTPGMALNSPLPTKIYLFRNRRSMAPYRLLKPDGEPADVQGYFLRRDDGNSVAVDAGTRGEPREVIYHEYLHYVLDNNLPDLPLWFNEGMAEVYSTFTIEGGRAQVGRPPIEHLYTLAAEGILPLAELFAIDADSPDYHEGRRRGVFYAQSWAIVHYLWIDGPTERRDATVRYLRLLSDGVDPEAALRREFDLSHRELERELELYLKRAQLSFLIYDLGDFAIDQTVASQPLPASEVYYQLGDLLARVDPRRHDEAERHFRAALDADPRYAAAWAGLGELYEMDGRRDEALALYEKALDLAAGDARLHFLVGSNLLDRLTGDGSFVVTTDPEARALARRAGEHFAASRALPGTPPEAHVGYGVTFLFAADGEDVGPGIEALSAVRRLLPGREDVAVNLGLLLIKAGRLDDAEALLVELVDPARQSARSGVAGEVETLARAALGRLEIERANRLLAAGRWSDGLARLEEAARTTTDPALAAQLTGEIWRIEQRVEYNRQVDEYNRAITLAGRGQVAEALAIVEGLLDEITDEGLAETARLLAERLAASLD